MSDIDLQNPDKELKKIAKKIAGGEEVTIGRVSWMGYLRPILLWVAVTFVVLLVASVLLLIDNITVTIISIFMLVSIPILIGVGLYIEVKSLNIFITNKGIGLATGTLPWNKRAKFIRWKDADNVVYYPTFLSLIAQSYKITIKHRYSDASNIEMDYVKRGNVVAELIETFIEQENE